MDLLRLDGAVNLHQKRDIKGRTAIYAELLVGLQVTWQEIVMLELWIMVLNGCLLFCFSPSSFGRSNLSSLISVIY